GGLALWFGWNWLDPVVSLVIAAVIVWGTWSLFRQSLHLLFDGVPESVDLHAVHSLLQGLPGVARVHDQHVWAMGTSEVALTAHLVMPEGGGGDAFLKHATDELHEQFEIRHVTLQVVREAFGEGCTVLATPTSGARPANPGHDGHNHEVIHGVQPCTDKAGDPTTGEPAAHAGQRPA
ncbi:MAG TPA: cation diffusion facilitator family transporter, partial [Rubrivivax sp.]|nr:cation diffusion facilitator family transporter [Rubrivivax sp.]